MDAFQPGLFELPDEPEDSSPRVVHCKTAPPGTFVSIGRPSVYGNPFPLEDARSSKEREAVIAQYKEWFLGQVASDAVFRSRVLALRGKNLGCWCKIKSDPGRPCHGDVILEWLSSTNE